MSRIVKYQVACPNPECGSSDAYSQWEDGHGYCFSCTRYFPHGDGEEPVETPSPRQEEKPFTLQQGPYRGFSEATVRKYGCHLRVDTEGKPYAIQYPYPKADGGGGLKVRTFPKTFHQEGVCSDVGCFGAKVFEAGAAQAVTITEGEDDAMAAYELLGSKYPVVSVQSSSTAKRDVLATFDWLNAFDKIYLCLDNDPAGHNAAKTIAALFDYNKVYYVKLTKHKDAQEYHAAKEGKEFVGAWWAASKFMPEGIVSSYADIDQILDGHGLEAIADYPFQTLQEVSYGVRASEVVLVTAESGVGKTEFVRALEHHFIKNTNENIGIIHLEEEKERCVKGLVGYEMQLPIHLPGVEMDKERIKAGWRDLVRTDNRVHLYSHFGSDDPDTIINTVRFMSSHAGCKFVFLDHITMLVSGIEVDDERRKLDYISTKLATLAREQDFTLFLVSHVNAEGGTHGSRNIHRVSDIRIHLSRDILNPDPAIRNQTTVTVLKNRYGSTCGPAGVLNFDPRTFVLTEFVDFQLPALGDN